LLVSEGVVITGILARISFKHISFVSRAFKLFPT